MNWDWPALTDRGFISGRRATLDDAQQGNAVFYLDGGEGDALPVVIPQYVHWKDGKGASHPMILVQAEQTEDGTELVGLRGFDGQETVASMPEVTLLGTKKPN